MSSIRSFFVMVTFLLLATDSFSNNYSFVVIGDIRPNFGSTDYENFVDQVKRIKEVHPDFIINLGDLIYGYDHRGDSTVWNPYLTLLPTIPEPYYQVPGNHDIFSKKAEQLYTSKFKNLYYSFNRFGNHFVVLDNTEKADWGRIEKQQLRWLENDLKSNQCQPTFVFMHFPLWDTTHCRINRKYHELWKTRLHPLFHAHHVAAVFAGHIHSYGPTYEYDGIRYFITGGGGAELDKWYKEYGGQHHFMLLNVRNNTFTYNIITKEGVLTEDQANVEKNHLFAEANASHAIVNYELLKAEKSQKVTIHVHNPFNHQLTGNAHWSTLKKLFSIYPNAIHVRVKPGETKSYTFKVKVKENQISPKEVPSISFELKSGKEHPHFARDLVLKKHLTIPFANHEIVFDGDTGKWKIFEEVASIINDEKVKSASITCAYTADYLYIGAKVRDSTAVLHTPLEQKEYGDALLIGLDLKNQKLSTMNNDFQLEFSQTTSGVFVFNRTTGKEVQLQSSGIKAVYTQIPGGYFYEIALPAMYLQKAPFTMGSRFGISFAVDNYDKEGKRSFSQWTPGISASGEDVAFQSQLHFAEATLK